MQYSESIDDFARIMTAGNNGGYANNWLVADRKTNEIASLELGLKNVNLLRTRDGYFAGANFAVNIKLIKEETDYPVDDAGFGANSRRLRWDQLLAENKGRVDVEAAKRFLADHYDAHEGKTAPSERTICGHIDLSSRGVSGWWGPYGPAGAVQNKVADAAMAERMSLFAAMGHACGLDFRAAPHLAAHPEFSWQKQYLRDLRAGTWSAFESLQ